MHHRGSILHGTQQLPYTDFIIVFFVLLLPKVSEFGKCVYMARNFHFALRDVHTKLDIGSQRKADNEVSEMVWARVAGEWRRGLINVRCTR